MSVLERLLVDAGFDDISIEAKDESVGFIREWAPGRHVDECVRSAVIRARKR